MLCFLQDVAEFETDMEEGSTITNDDVKEMEVRNAYSDLSNKLRFICSCCLYTRFWFNVGQPSDIPA